MIKIIIAFILIPFSLLFCQLKSSLVLSEIMFNPESGNNEFIEIYNTSSTDSVDLIGFKIKYSTANPDVITGQSGSTILKPNSYAVIFEGDYDIENGIYKELVPNNALTLQISDAAFGSSGMANTSDRDVLLLDPAGDTLAFYLYSANNEKGISDEKILLNSDNSSLNWGNSKILNGTPGFRNSITPFNFDLTVTSKNILPFIPKSGDNVNLFITVKNIGLITAGSFIINLYNDLNNDSAAAESELIDSQTFLNLLPGDSVTLSSEMMSLNKGIYHLIAKVIFPEDENTLNDVMNFSFRVYPPPANYNDVVINEIMYTPGSGQPEWIELFNKTDKEINLNKWKISDNNTTTKIINNDFFIPPRSYILISKDSAIKNIFVIKSPLLVANFPSLNNTGDAVVIKDSLNTIVDSLFYQPSWGGNNGSSLERISFDNPSFDSSNWETSSSKSKATPGYINSVTQKQYDIEASDLIFEPENPYFDNDVQIKAKIVNKGKLNANFSLQLFEDTNNDSIPDILIKSLENLSLGQNDSSVIDLGYSIINLSNKRSFYLDALFSNDEDTSNNYTYKSISPGYPAKTILINEIMYSPSGGEPEWIEIYNTSQDSVNVKNWSVTDVITTPVKAVIKEDIFIPSKGYLVIAKDDNIKNYHRIIPAKIAVLNLPVLNNDYDGVVFKDNRDIVMDSVIYNKNLGGTNGFSLERKSIETGSNLSGNWGSSLDIELSTPGRINSITTKQHDLAISEITFNPRFPTSGENVNINAKIKNLGTSRAESFSVNFLYNSDSNSTSEKILSTESNLNLNPDDSIIISSSSYINKISTKILTAAQVIYNEDQNPYNNYLENYVEPGYSSNSLLINEVMYAPENSSPEWIELFNPTADTLNLKNWSVSDILPRPTKNFITNEDLLIPPNEFLILTPDSSFAGMFPYAKIKMKIVNFGTLGNTQDGIIIYDFRDGIIDSLFYNSSWGGKNGYSLERISTNSLTNDSTNWVTSLSIFKGTPGEENSVLNIPSYKRNDLIINEIMFDPGNDNNEFIEFLNISSSPINIGGWKIEDLTGHSLKLSETALTVPSGAYFLFAADSSVILKYNLFNLQYKTILNSQDLGLNNSEDLILLKDISGTVIDSLYYFAKWHNKNFVSTQNISLEKINPKLNTNDPSNWSSSADKSGATPGRQNSIYAALTNSESKISIAPNPFSPDNDGFEDNTIISYNLTQSTSQVRIRIYDSHGRLVRTLINNQPSGGKGSVIFNGLDDRGNPLRIGIYIVYLEALNQSSGVLESLKKVVVVARKLN